MRRIQLFVTLVLAPIAFACSGSDASEDANAASGGVAGTTASGGASGSTLSTGNGGAGRGGGAEAGSTARGGSSTSAGGSSATAGKPSGAAASSSGGMAQGGMAQGGAPGPGGSKPCDLFHDPWEYRVATYYEPGQDPIVAGIYGGAEFYPDGTYEQNYRIGGISNIYSGNYTLAGDRLLTYSDEGELVFDYTVSCSDELRTLVLTLENDDGTPSIVYGLESVTE